MPNKTESKTSGESRRRTKKTSAEQPTTASSGVGDLRTDDLVVDLITTRLPPSANDLRRRGSGCLPKPLESLAYVHPPAHARPRRRLHDVGQRPRDRPLRRPGEPRPRPPPQIARPTATRSRRLGSPPSQQPRAATAGGRQLLPHRPAPRRVGLARGPTPDPGRLRRPTRWPPPRPANPPPAVVRPARLAHGRRDHRGARHPDHRSPPAGLRRRPPPCQGPAPRQRGRARLRCPPRPRRLGLARRRRRVVAPPGGRPTRRRATSPCNPNSRFPLEPSPLPEPDS